MKSLYVSDLEPGREVTGVFLVQHKDVRQKKTGEPYLSLLLADRTGDIDAKMWDNVAQVMDSFERNDFVRVTGRAAVYQNRLQFTVQKLLRICDSEVDLSDFIPASQRDPEEMFAELQGIIASIGNPHLRALLEAIFADPGIATRYKRAPAAKSIHHAWLGGLIEHVLSLCQLCRVVAPLYPGIDLDLLLTGAILHDIGKIEELVYDRAFSYSDAGQLLGHIHIGLKLVGAKLDQLPDFPPRLRLLLEHLILSHHGALEFGSPKVPLFAEALLLHHLDNLDSKMEALRSSVERNPADDSVWTGFNLALERPLLRKERFLNPPEPPEASPPPANSGSGRQQPAKPMSLFGEQLRNALRKD
jgi:3'-5' exoribonuclease